LITHTYIPRKKTITINETTTMRIICVISFGSSFSL